MNPNPMKLLLITVIASLMYCTSHAQGTITINPDTLFTVVAPVEIIDTLIVNDKDLIALSPSLTGASLTIHTLILNGNSTFDLSYHRPYPPELPSQPRGSTGINPSSSSPPAKGGTGATGLPGGAGSDGASLKLTVDKLVVNGAMWICTDGGRGGNGGKGGDGGFGSDGPQTRYSNPDGGQGGDGGAGGPGGTGGNTSFIVVQIANHVITPFAQPCCSPTPFPNMNGFKGILISGSPGSGGYGGPYGNPGIGGKGHKAHFPSTDSKDGGPGGHLGPGTPGANGVFIK